MNSRKAILLLMLLMFGIVGQAFAAATIAVAPTNVPKGAYVNGPLGETDDNFFWQTVTITANKAAGHNSAATMTLNLPNGMSLAKVLSTGSYPGHVSVSFVTAGNGTFSVNTATASTIVLNVDGTGGFQQNDTVTLMFPVSTLVNPPASTDDYYVDFSDDAGIDDDVANGDGTMVTFVAPGPNTIGAVTFTSYLLADNDTTSVDGEVYPNIGTAANSALPDYLVENAQTVESTLFGAATLNIFTLNDGLNDRDMTYKYYAAQDSTLSHIKYNDTGVHQLFIYDPTAAPHNMNNLSREGYTGNRGFTVANLPEGTWYVYVVSTITGDFPLARSGKLLVRHQPLVDVLAWDFDASGTLVNPTDNANMTLDSGLFVGINGAILPSVAPTDEVDIYIAVDDFNDDAKVALFYSTNAALTDTNIVITGTSPNLVVTGLTGANLIATNLLENDENEDGFIVVNWNIQPTADTQLISADSYTLYAVAWDGKNANITACKGFDETNKPSYSGTTQLSLTVRHSPDFVFDSLDEYNLGTDTAYNADITIDQSQTDVVMINWGKAGINGDRDVDNNCTIEFYIDYDTDANPDYGSDDYEAIRTAASSSAGITSTGTHRINPTALTEDPDTKIASYYAWNLKEDWQRTTWAPVEENGAAGSYRIYAIISEGDATTDTKRVVCMGIDGVFDGGAVPPTPATRVEFANSQAYVKLFDPPVKGMSVTASETFRLNLAAFDIDADTPVGIFAVNANAGNVLTNGDFEDGAGSWTAGVGWTIAGGVATHATGAGNTLVSNSNQTDATSSYTLTFEIKNTTAGVIVPSKGANIPAVNYGTNGVYSVTFTSTAAGHITFTPNAAFDGQIDNVSLINNTNPVGGELLTVANLLTYRSGTTYVLTSDNGTRAAHVTFPWLSDDTLASSPYYDIALRVPGSATARYTTDIKTNVVSLADGDYWLYIGADNANGNFAAATTKLYRSPGKLTVIGAGTAVAQKNLMMEPRSFVTTIGDTTRVSIRMADEGNAVDFVDLYIAVDKEFFDIVSSSLPFTDPVGLGSMLKNETIDDAVNNRWVLHTTIFNSGDVINTTNTGLGSEIASFRVVNKGTSTDNGEASAIIFVNEPAKDWVTKYANDGVNLSFGASDINVKIQPRGSIRGTLSFQGRTTAANTVTFKLRKRGSYEPITDTLFSTANDGYDYAVQAVTLPDSVKSLEGIQYKLNNDGDFKLSDVPTGEWSLSVYYDRYLAKAFEIDVQPGLDTLQVVVGELKGGDVIGYTDASNDAFPNNVINQDDVNRIAEAYGSTPDSSRWDTATVPSTGGKYNYKWSDINENGEVEDTDLMMATNNFLFGGSASIGAQPIYQKPAVSPETNLDALVEFMNVPTVVKAGQTYTVQVVVRNAADVKGYSVKVGFNSDLLTPAAIVKGDFIKEQSYSFPLYGTSEIGLVNAVYGPYNFTGDGVLAEIYFTANRDGAFSADMLTVTRANLVDSSFQGIDLAKDLPTVVDGGEEIAPVAFELNQNFPNPFNPTTTISFNIPRSGVVDVTIYDILGRQVKTLVSGVYQPGAYSAVWDATDMNGNIVSNGVYFYTIKSAGYTQTKKMMFMK